MPVRTGAADKHSQGITQVDDKGIAQIAGPRVVQVENKGIAPVEGQNDVESLPPEPPTSS